MWQTKIGKDLIAIGANLLFAIGKKYISRYGVYHDYE